MQRSAFGFGITGDVDEDIVRQLAPQLEQAGFRTMWFNDTPGGDSLRRIEIAADVTTRLRFGTGVIPVDRVPVAQILERLNAPGFPIDRVTIGVGSSARPSPLTRIRSAIHDIKESTDVAVVIGALGPKMRALAAERADGMLLNWLTPDAARLAQQDKTRDAGGRDVSLVLYIRTGLGGAAIDRVRAEAERYAKIPSYAANLQRLGITAMDTAVVGTHSQDLTDGLAAFEGIVDEPVIRAIPGEQKIEAYASLINALTG